MKVRDALAMHQERSQLIRDDLVSLYDFPVTVLPAVSSEYLNNLAKDDPGKRLQFLAFLYLCNASVSPPEVVAVTAPARTSRLSLALKAAGFLFSVGQGLLRLRSQKLQAALTKWSLLLYYSMFRATAFIR
jgi:hypothetical protein